MANKVTYATKIKAIIALAMPLLYFLMFLPIWNGNELKIIPIDVIDIIQIASLLIAVINLYQNTIKRCKKIKNVTERANALLEAEAAFDTWMDTYPECEKDPEKLEIQKKHNQFMDKMGLNPKDKE